MTATPHFRPIFVLSSLGRVGRLTWVEILKLMWHKLFPVTVILTVLVTAGLGIAAKQLSSGAMSGAQFSNYSLWVASSSFGLRVGMLLLAAIGAMAMSSEATARTLNTVLTRPIRRIEFAAAKVLSLVFATVVVVAASALAAYVVGGTAPGERSSRVSSSRSVEAAPARFPSYGDVVDPLYPDVVIASKGEVMGEIWFGFLLLVVPVLAGVSLGFLLGTLLDSSGLAVGLSAGLFVTLEGTKFIPLLEEFLGKYAYNYPLNRISTIMLQSGKGSLADWHDALVGVGISGIYVGVCLLVSLVVFCRRDVTL